MNAVTHDTRLAEWFAQWRQPIRRWLASRYSVPVAELDDMAQEVFLRLLKYADGKEIEYPQSYLFHVAANVAKEWRERFCVCKPHEEEWLHGLTNDDDNEPESAADCASRDKQVRAAIEHLPQRKQTILMMHVRDGLTYKQIAKRLTLPPRLVRRDIANSYAALRTELQSIDLRRDTTGDAA